MSTFPSCSDGSPARLTTPISSPRTLSASRLHITQVARILPAQPIHLEASTLLVQTLQFPLDQPLLPLPYLSSLVLATGLVRAVALHQSLLTSARLSFAKCSVSMLTSTGLISSIHFTT